MAEKNIDVAMESTCQEILRVVNESGSGGDSGSDAAARLLCAGTAGTVFTIHQTKGYAEDVVVTLTAEDLEKYDGHYYRYVSVPLEAYDINVKWLDYSYDTTIDVINLGETYPVEYWAPLATFTTSGSYTVPDNMSTLLFTACGGGGGGGGAAYGGGAGGGGGADYIFLKVFPVTPGDTLDITIGSAGSAGKGSVSGSTSTYCTDGGTGGTTVIGDLVSLVGGGGGGKTEEIEVTKFSTTVERWRGAAGAGRRDNNGGIGGIGTAGASDSATGSKGSGGAAASRTSPAKPGSAGGDASASASNAIYESRAGGGGGGGCIGEGGDGAPGLASAVTTSPASAGGYGAGGGGGGGRSSSVYGTDGAKGGNGIVYIYTGVTFEWITQ